MGTRNSAVKKALMLIRPWHVIGILAAQVMTLFNLSLEPKQNDLIWFFIASTLAIIGSHVIRDIKDYESDQINEPDKVWIGKRVSVEGARYLYWSLFFSASIAAFMISVEAYFLFTVVQLLQFANAVWLKKLPIVGSFLMSAVTVYSILIVPEIFDAPLEDYPWPVVYIGFYILLLIELVSDIRSVKGDKINKRWSLPVLLGVDVSLSVLWVLVLLPAVLFLIGFFYFLSVYWNTIFYTQEQETIFAVLLMLVFVVIPICYLTFVTYRCRIGKHSLYSLQRELKIMLVLGMLYWGIGLFSARVISYDSINSGFKVTQTTNIAEGSRLFVWNTQL